MMIEPVNDYVILLINGVLVNLNIFAVFLIAGNVFLTISMHITKTSGINTTMYLWANIATNPIDSS